METKRNDEQLAVDRLSDESHEEYYLSMLTGYAI